MADDMDDIEDMLEAPYKQQQQHPQPVESEEPQENDAQLVHQQEHIPVNEFFYSNFSFFFLLKSPDK